MTLEDNIVMFEGNAEIERKNGDLHGCLNFRRLAEWLKELKAHREAWEKVKSELWIEGVYMGGERHGLWVRYQDIAIVIDENRPEEV